MRDIDILNELREPGYEVALLSTYSIDLSFFEKTVLGTLLDNSCHHIGIFTDHGMLMENYQDGYKLSDLGRSYLVQHVPTTGAFHPKIYLLLGDKKAKVIVTSSNLTAAGMLKNAEVGNVFKIDEGNMASLSIIRATYDFFRTIYSRNQLRYMLHVLSEAEKFSYLSKGDFEDRNQEFPMFLSNVRQPIMDQLEALLPDDIKRIRVIAPYFDQQLMVMDRWLRNYPDVKVEFLLQNETSNFPLEKDQSSAIELKEFHFHAKQQPRYHGKVFHFEGEQKGYVVYGSANCSKQAMLSSAENGNMEAIMFEENSSNEFQSFLDEKVQVGPLSPDFKREEVEEEPVSNKCPVIFREAVYEEKLEVVLESSEEINAVFINKQEGQFVKQMGELYFFTWNSKPINTNIIFGITVMTEIGEFEVQGWYQDWDKLYLTFTQQIGKPYRKVQDDPELRDYQNVVDLLNDLYQRLVLDEEDMMKQREENTSTSTIHDNAELQDEDIEVSNNEDDYYDLSEEGHTEKYGVIKGKDVLSDLISALLSQYQLASGASNERITPKYTPKNNGNTGEPTIQLMNHVMKRMDRFRKKFLKGLTSPAYMEKVEAEVLIKNATIYAHFLMNFSSREISKIIQVYEETADFKKQLVLNKKLLKKKQETINDLLQIANAITRYGKKSTLSEKLLESNNIVPLLLASLLLQEKVIEEGDDMMDRRHSRKKISIALKEIHEHVAPIRYEYDRYLEQIVLYMAKLDYETKEKELRNRLEQLFDFHSLTHFKELIRENPNINFHGNLTNSEANLHIETELNLSGPFNMLQLTLLTSMLNVMEWSDKTQFTITFHNNKQDGSLNRLVLVYSKDKKSLETKYEYHNGNKMEYQKDYVTVPKLITAAERGNSEFMAKDFKLKY
ncbi:HKD family nuclease/translation elongation factor P/translation initiation factor 5A [Evansella vedderi]|uniref:HKD family nuclease/translation elongation factor P/translation initiation factor 5A n=1 Tax=Evansella vedderi TaxID=38282 RepID=A0ABT9ZQY7_9BACI|nr:hypothetical protein [Evansella vedderi]MDQ0253370.1 HKD family nuclease/translation elongation factor P/translation initiation factor 5A [Evansella vedderi]